ncbi:MAG: 4Fe-4S ferredoxin [Desulfobulbaceae bacterium]|nr:MAG: 4Fe-4S ferredoxin [Desulfobulbaceae bacterium]
MKQSTRAYFQEAKRMGRYGLKERLHGYIYARWPYLYIGIGTGSHPSFKWLKRMSDPLIRLFRFLTGIRGARNSNKDNTVSFADTYHGKVLTLEGARQLVTVNQPIRLENLEKIIPYQRARDIVMLNPDKLAVMECPCRSTRENPCLPLAVCLVVGEPFVSFIVEHHPDKSRRITPAEAIEILEQENDRGHVAHAFFKDVMLDRFYAICNCCSCCCGAMQAQQNGTPMLASSGFVCEVDEEYCTSCGSCVEVCQFEALTLSDFAVIDEQKCMGCGVCETHCSVDAITLRREPSRGEPLEIEKLMATYQARVRKSTED